MKAILQDSGTHQSPWGKRGRDKKGKRKKIIVACNSLSFSPTPLRVSRLQHAVDLTLFEAVAAC